jgi:hypothetical protein
MSKHRSFSGPASYNHQPETTATTTATSKKQTITKRTSTTTIVTPEASKDIASGRPPFLLSLEETIWLQHPEPAR